MTILAIDQGTSATKALLVGPGAEVLGRGESPFRTRAWARTGGGRPGGASIRSCAAGRQALARRGSVRRRGRRCANQGETVLAWDRSTGRPLPCAIVWQDRRVGEVCARLADRAGRLAAITGLPLDPYFAAPKMAWLRENVTRRGRVTTTDTWLLRRLRRGFVTDAATASRTMLLDLRPRPGRTDGLAAFGLDRGGAAGDRRTAPDRGRDLRASGRPCPSPGSLVDQQAALLAEAASAAGDAKCTYGTGAFLLVNAGGSRRCRSGLAVLLGLADRRRGDVLPGWPGLHGGFGAAAGSRIGVLGAPSELDAVGSRVGRRRRDLRPRAAPGSPRPTGAAARGQLSGLHLGTSRGHVVRAVCRGHRRLGRDARAAAMERDLAGPSQRCAWTGPDQVPLLMQAQADLLQRAGRSAVADATALGVAALARLGTGLRGLAPRPWRPRRRDVEPPITADRRPNGSRALPRGPRPHAGAAIRTQAWPTCVVIGAGVVGTAIARALARYTLERRCWSRRAADVGDRDVEGEHGDPAHRLRRQARHARVPARRRGQRPARALRRGGRHPGRDAPARCSSPGTPSSAPRCPHRGERAAATATGRAAASARRSSTARAAARAGRARGAGDPDESIVCPVDHAARVRHRGGRARASRLLLGATVTGATSATVSHEVPHDARSRCGAGWVVNAAGLGSDEIDRMFGRRRFTVPPRRGELIVFDKLARPLVRHILLPVPTARDQGGAGRARRSSATCCSGRPPRTSPTRRDTATTAAGLRSLLRQGRRILPALLAEEVTADLRGAARRDRAADYQIRVDAEQRYVCVGGIRSTGLTASLAIAEHVSGCWGGRAARCAARGAGRRVRCRTSARRRCGRTSDADRDRGRPGVRPDRLPLRAGHARRDPGCPRLPGAGPHARRAAPPHPGAAGPLPGLLLRGRRGRALPGARPSARVCAGTRTGRGGRRPAPAAACRLAAATELAAARRRRRCSVVERETRGRRRPRHAHHTGLRPARPAPRD